jgi:hypothetical protein
MSESDSEVSSTSEASDRFLQRFTCFTGTNRFSQQFTCFTSTKVPILTHTEAGRPLAYGGYPAFGIKKPEISVDLSFLNRFLRKFDDQVVSNISADQTQFRRSLFFKI